jgi:hypothetical protein
VLTATGWKGRAWEFLEQVREIEATGGLRLEDFIAEVEAMGRPG